jgi:hypothetical protein
MDKDNSSGSKNAMIPQFQGIRDKQKPTTCWANAIPGTGWDMMWIETFGIAIRVNKTKQLTEWPTDRYDHWWYWSNQNRYCPGVWLTEL